MSLLKEYFYNIKCDCCGAIGNEEIWNNEPIRDEILGDRNWKNLGGKDYCENCWKYDDNYNILTADGHVWNPDTKELIKVTTMTKTIKERARELCKRIDANKGCEGDIFSPYAELVEIAEEQRDKDIEKACEWFELFCKRTGLCDREWQCIFCPRILKLKQAMGEGQ